MPLEVKANANQSVEMVTPTLAAAWLNRGGKNRLLNPRRVEAMAQAMRRGEWKLTYEAIKLDEEGQVRDGQHRLHAIVKSGTPVLTAVVRGVGEDAFDVMGSGTRRSIADVLGIHDYTSGSAVGAAVRLLMAYERYGEFERTSAEMQVLVTPITVLNYLKIHTDVEAGVQLGKRVKRAGLVGGVGTWGALFTLFTRTSAEDAHLFAHHLITGEDMSQGHPALLLRNRFSKLAGKPISNSTERQALAAMVIKAWNAFRLGKTLAVLRWAPDGLKPEPFPKVN